jgi:hypothetical protein
MRNVEVINHKGKEICYLDFSHLRDEKEIQALINEGKKHIRSKIPGSVFNLSNIEEMHFNGEIREMFSEFVKGNKTYIKASAVVGVSGLKQIVFNGIMKITGRDIRSFNTNDQAKDWLVSHN